MVTDSPSITRPIIGFNVISHLIAQSGKDVASEQLKGAMQDVNEGKLLAQEEVFGVVKTGKHDICIPAKQTKWVKGVVHSEAVLDTYSAMFEPRTCNENTYGLTFQETVVSVPKGSTFHVRVPVQNNFNHDIILKKRSEIGSIQGIQSVIALADKRESFEPQVRINQVVQEELGQRRDTEEGIEFNVELSDSDLTAEQVSRIKGMLYEEMPFP